jgi:hypothetical protein
VDLAPLALWVLRPLMLRDQLETCWKLLFQQSSGAVHPRDTGVRDAGQMIAIDATLRPNESPNLLQLVRQRFLKRFIRVRTVDERVLVLMPALGRVLITEEAARMHLEFVVENEEAVPAAMYALENEVRTQVGGNNFSLQWGRNRIVPAALR